MTDRQALFEWLGLLDDDYIQCLIEVAGVLFADQNGIDIAPWLD